MGVKRPLGEENLPELSFKQPKQLDDINQMSTFMTHDLPTAVLKIDSSGEVKSNSCELQFNERLETGETHCASSVDNELERMRDRVEIFSEFQQHKQFDDNNDKLEASAPLLFATTTIDEENAGYEDNSSFLHSFPNLFEDPYVFLLNSSPRKEPPVGPDYQAELPNWDPRARELYFSAPNEISGNDRAKTQMGTWIIPMPDSNDSILDKCTVGHGRTDCNCSDVGSTRCVQQHVNEARENLRESIGDEAFEELGFYDMGEGVARNWTVDEEQLFHEVVFSNPASCGRDFWEHLSFMFPNRTKKEIVSYYFNVFMLRRRAVQNRSYLMNIDSDDDEEHESVRGEHCLNISLDDRHSSDDDDDDDDDNNDDDDVNRTHADFYLVGEDNEDLMVKSIGDQDLESGWINDYRPDPKNVDEENSDSNRGTGDDNADKHD